MRIIFHVDIDAFFAACEEREDAKLRGRPLVIGALPSDGRGVVSTANYEARKYGVASGMPISKAYRLCPGATYMRPNFPLYVSTSERIMHLLRKHGRVEQVSIDEAFLDANAKSYGAAERLAKRIKKEILAKEKLTCSIGIAPNKLVAKVASDFRKPDGLTVVRGDAKSFLAPLHVRKLPGIGKKGEAALSEMGIETVGELAAADRQLLAERFGKFGITMHEYASGKDESGLVEEWEAKSIGREHTFLRDTSSSSAIKELIENICSLIYSDIAEQKLAFKTVVVKLRYSNFQTLTRQRSLKRREAGLKQLKAAALALFDEAYSGRPLRLVGVRVAGLSSTEKQKSVEEFAAKGL